VARSGGPELLRRRWRATGVEMRPSHSGTSAERGKPVVSPAPSPRGARESEPQGEPMGQRVKEEGESQRRPVMGRIGVEPPGDITLPRKRADFPLVWHHERTWLTDFRERRRYVGSGNACWCGSQPWRQGVCLLQAGIVKVSSSKQAAARVCATRRPRGTIRLRGGSRTLPTAERK